MKSKDIPVYKDPDDLEALGPAAKYPCSTDRMTYNPLTHKYYLTLAALVAFGVDIEQCYSSDAPDKAQEFIDEVTEDVYGIIDFLAPFNIRYSYCLVAQSSSIQFRDRYTARKQFEKALLYQARYKSNNIDPRETNGIDYETGNNIYLKALRKEGRHLHPRTIDILDKLGLLYNGDDVPRNIDFERFM